MFLLTDEGFKGIHVGVDYGILFLNIADMI